MVYAAVARDDEERRAAPCKVLEDWAQMYGARRRRAPSRS